MMTKIKTLLLKLLLGEDYSELLLDADFDMSESIYYSNNTWILLQAVRPGVYQETELGSRVFYWTTE
jgi:hypothetical protein